MSKTIKSKSGHEFIVDDEDFERVNKFKWYPKCSGNNVYAIANSNGKIKPKTFLMHRFIMGAKEGQEVDHINGNPSDNRKENLRICTHQENMRNKKKQTRKNKYKGVFLHYNKWYCTITCNGERHYGKGSFTEKEAALEYNEMAKKLFGEFACLNDVKNRT